MTLIERVRFRLAMLKVALKAAAKDVRLGFTLRPIAGADGAGEDERGKEGEGSPEGEKTQEGEGGKENEPEGGGEGEPFDEARAKEALSKKNREAQNLRKRLKELEPLANKAKELEDASKSEAERLAEAKSSAEGRAQKAEADVLRLGIAIDKGLTGKQARAFAKRLVGETEEELEADADELLESFKPKEAEEENEEGEGQEPSSQRRPKERLRPGAAPNAERDTRGPKELAESVPRTW